MAHAPSGLIAIWHASIATIPTGWVICDGNNGTPDLRDLFVRGASIGGPPGTTGGADEHQHTFTSGLHSHTIPGGSGIASGSGVSTATGNRSAAGTTGLTSSLPPYYALAYIMKT